MLEQSINRCSLFALLAVGSAITLGGCTSTSSSTSETSAGGNEGAQIVVEKQEWAINHDDWGRLGYDWKWTGFPPLQPGAMIGHARVHDDVLVFQGNANTLSVLETKTGKVRWSRQIDRPSTRFFEAVREGGTLFASSDTDLWEIDIKNGNTLDRATLGTLANTSPLIMGNIAILGTATGELFGWERRNDFKLWSYQFDGLFDVAPVAIDEEYFAAISSNGEIRVLNAETARSKMSVQIAGGTGAEMLTDQIGLYVVSDDQSIYAFDVEDGFRYWRKRSSAPVTIQHTLYDNVVYATTLDTGLSAMDAVTGEVLWANEDVHGWAITVLDASELVVWSGKELFLIDKDRGDIVERMPLSNQDIAGIRTNSIDNGDLYVVTLEGTVAKMSLK